MDLLRRATLLIVFTALAAGAGATLRLARQTAPSTLEAVLDAPTLPSSVKQVLSLGFRSVAADLGYLQAIQIYGDRSFLSAPLDERRHRSLVIARLLEDATELDPRFDYAYVFAANAIPVARPDGSLLNIEETIGLLRKGTRNGGSDWRLPFYLSYYLSTHLGDIPGAAEAMAEAARRPKRPEYVPLLATRLAAAGGSIETGIQLAEALAAQAETDEDREPYLERVRLLRMERDIRELGAALQAYETRVGHPATTLQELVTAGVIATLPAEPHGGTYLLDAATKTVRSSAAERLKLPKTVEEEIQNHLKASQRPFWEIPR